MASSYMYSSWVASMSSTACSSRLIASWAALLTGLTSAAMPSSSSTGELPPDAVDSCSLAVSSGIVDALAFSCGFGGGLRLPFLDSAMPFLRGIRSASDTHETVSMPKLADTPVQ